MTESNDGCQTSAASTSDQDHTNQSTDRGICQSSTLSTSDLDQSVQSDPPTLGCGRKPNSFPWMSWVADAQSNNNLPAQQASMTQESSRPDGMSPASLELADTLIIHGGTDLPQQVLASSKLDNISPADGSSTAESTQALLPQATGHVHGPRAAGHGPQAMVHWPHHRYGLSWVGITTHSEQSCSSSEIGDTALLGPAAL